MKPAYRLGLLALLIFSIQPAYLHAQSVSRTVLLEEGTNWACPPCAIANPYIEQFVKEHAGSVIHLAYHPNWPGSTDPMYLNDKTDNQFRVATFYGISGVPSVVFDGSDVFNPAGIGQLNAFWMIHANKPSPIALKVTHTEVGSSVRVDVTLVVVGSVASYSNLYLRVAAVESEVDAKGSNGEPKHADAMRTMMPGYQGTKLTIKQGDSLTYSFTYPLLSSYTSSRMYDVAFVQTDAASHEVLQAASSQQTQQLTLEDGSQLFGRVPASPTLSLRLTNHTAVQGTYTVRYFPTSPNPWTITVNGQDANLQQTINVPSNASQAIHLAATPSSAGYTGGVLVVAGSTGDTSVIPFKMIAQDVKTAFVDVFGDSTTEMQTELALTKLGERYAELSSVEVQAMQAWSKAQFPEIIVGAGKWIINGNDKDGVRTFLASGGHLLLHGGEIGYGLADANASTTNDKPFMSSVLHATYVKDSAGPRELYGVITDPVAMNMPGPINLYSKTFELNQPDQINIVGNASPVFYYGSALTQVAGLRFADRATDQRLVYLAFGLENLSTDDEATIVSNTLKWFRSPLAVGQSVEPTQFALSQNYPNPFNPTTEIKYSLDRATQARMVIYDVQGNVVREVFNNWQEQGAHVATVDASQLASGVYYYELRAGSTSLRKSMMLLK